MAFLLNGKPLAVDVPFTYGDIHYPANWLRLSTAEEKTAIGITEVEDPKVYDTRFYWTDGTAKAIEGNTDAFIPPIPKPKMAMTLPIRNELIKEYFPDMLVKVKEWF